MVYLWDLGPVLQEWQGQSAVLCPGLPWRLFHSRNFNHNQSGRGGENVVTEVKIADLTKEQKIALLQKTVESLTPEEKQDPVIQDKLQYFKPLLEKKQKED